METANERVAALARLAAKGDENAFNELYLLTRDRAYFVAFSITRNEQDALDIIQESYLKVWKKLMETDSPEVCTAWIKRIVANTAKDYVTKRRPLLFQSADEDDDPLDWQPERDSDYVPDASMDTAETRRLIMEIVDGLPEDQRLCVLMHYYDDMEIGEIAEALNVPYDTVKSRLRYARKKISDGVEGLEKKGTKLYGAAPVPLFIWLLRNAASESSKKLPPIILGGAAGTAATGGGILAAITLPKLIAGIAAVVIVGGGTAAGVVAAKRGQPEPVNAGTTVAVMAPGEDSTAEAFFASALTLPDFPAYSESTSPFSAADTQSIMPIPGTGTAAASAIIGAQTTTLPPNTPQPITLPPTTPLPTPPPTPPPTQPPVITYTVTYNFAQNGGSSATKTSASAAKGSAADLSPTASKSGWQFVGWNTNKDATAGLSSLTVNGNVTLYAIFKKTETPTEPPTEPPPVTYTVTYNYTQNGGSSATKTSASVQKGGAADLTPTASKTNWEFVGWNTNSSASTGLSSLTVNGNVTLYAIFTDPAADYTYENATIGKRITGYIGSATSITVPATIGGLPVTEIGADAFNGEPVVSVDLPASVTTIGAAAFANCVALQSLIIRANTVNFSIVFPFGGCTQLTVRCPAGSQVYDYCVAEGIPVQAL